MTRTNRRESDEHIKDRTPASRSRKPLPSLLDLLSYKQGLARATFQRCFPVCCRNLVKADKLLLAIDPDSFRCHRQKLGGIIKAATLHIFPL